MVPSARFTDGQSRPIRNIYCVGRNYINHAHELNNPVPEEPLLFMKSTASVATGNRILLPESATIHHELELVCFIGREIPEPGQEIAAAIQGYTLGLDLTDRPLQQKMKDAGKPWFRAKSFRNSTILGDFIPADEFNLDEPFFLRKNGQQVQSGAVGDMIFPIEVVLQSLAERLPLGPGDILFTGTPAGVGPLQSGDVIEIGPRPAYSITIL